MSEPLDLEAVERRLNASPIGGYVQQDVDALIAEVRKLRKAGEHALWIIDGSDLDGYDHGVSDFAALRRALASPR